MVVQMTHKQPPDLPYPPPYSNPPPPPPPTPSLRLVLPSQTTCHPLAPTRPTRPNGTSLPHLTHTNKDSGKETVAVLYQPERDLQEDQVAPIYHPKPHLKDLRRQDL